MQYRIGTLSEGLVGAGRVRGICECRWRGPWHLGLSSAIAEAEGDVEEHAATHAGGVVRAPFFVMSARGIAYHRACGHHHSLADDCPAPAGSPAGLLRTLLGASTEEPGRAALRLTSAVSLAKLVHDEGASAVLGARMAGVSWDEVERICVNLDFDVAELWLEPVRHMEAVGLLGSVGEGSWRLDDLPRRAG